MNSVCVCVCGRLKVAIFIYHVAPPLPRALLLSSVCDEHPEDLSALHPLTCVCVCACVCGCVCACVCECVSRIEGKKNNQAG